MGVGDAETKTPFHPGIEAKHAWETPLVTPRFDPRSVACFSMIFVQGQRVLNRTVAGVWASTDKCSGSTECLKREVCTQVALHTGDDEEEEAGGTSQHDAHVASRKPRRSRQT